MEQGTSLPLAKQLSCNHSAVGMHREDGGVEEGARGRGRGGATYTRRG